MSKTRALLLAAAGLLVIGAAAAIGAALLLTRTEEEPQPNPAGDLSSIHLSDESKETDGASAHENAGLDEDPQNPAESDPKPATTPTTEAEAASPTPVRPKGGLASVVAASFRNGTVLPTAPAAPSAEETCKLSLIVIGPNDNFQLQSYSEINGALVARVWWNGHWYDAAKHTCPTHSQGGWYKHMRGLFNLTGVTPVWTPPEPIAAPAPALEQPQSMPVIPKPATPTLLAPPSRVAETAPVRQAKELSCLPGTVAVSDGILVISYGHGCAQIRVDNATFQVKAHKCDRHKANCFTGRDRTVYDLSGLEDRRGRASALPVATIRSKSSRPKKGSTTQTAPTTQAPKPQKRSKADRYAARQR